NKREGYRKAFADFDPAKVARFNEQKVAKLLENPAIVRNRMKIGSAIENAKAYCAIQREIGSFDAFVWQFVGGKPKVNAWQSIKEIPARTTESDAMSKELIRRGFRFAGSTICYAFMQAAGMVNDHLVGCFRYEELR